MDADDGDIVIRSLLREKMIWDFLVRHGWKPLIVAVAFGLAISFLPFVQHTTRLRLNSTNSDNNSDADDYSSLQVDEITTVEEEETVDSDYNEEAGIWPTSDYSSLELDSNNTTTSEVQSPNNATLEQHSTNDTTVPVLNFTSSTTKNSDYIDWMNTFFPQFLDDTSQLDKFYKAVGRYSHAVCEVGPDQWDYSGGWLSRSMAYLYHANKTRVTCKPYPSATPHLDVVTGQTLYHHLNTTLSKRHCTVVFFFSGVCPFCRRAAPLMHSAAIYFPSLKFMAVDTDKYPGVAGHYGIMGVPVVVLFYEKRFITGWTIPYPDARDTIRAFVMAHTDAKYIKGPQPVDFTTGDTVLGHFHLRRENDVYYMLSYVIIVASLVRLFWDRFLWDFIRGSLERSGLDGGVFVVRAPPPPTLLVVPVPAQDLPDDNEIVD